MAYPFKLTPARAKQIVEAIGEGCPIRAACAKAGVSHTTFGGWLNDARDAKIAADQGEALTARQKTLVAFAAEVELAEDAAEALTFDRFLAEAQKDRGKGNWLPWLKLLALRWPERWAERYAARGDEDRPDEYDLSMLTTDQLRALRDLLKEARLSGSEAQPHRLHAVRS
jgi:hypothetical protein